MVEVEIKIAIDDLDFIKEQILGLGFVFSAKFIECDTYYTSAWHDFRNKDEALRVREIKNLSTEECSSVITYKGKKFDQVSMSRMELETEVSDGNILKNIFKMVGFEQVIPVEKVRSEYKKDDMTICLDDVKNLGTFMEIEILVENKTNYPQALNQIESLLSEMNLDIKDTIQTSYLSMLEKKFL